MHRFSLLKTAYFVIIFLLPFLMGTSSYKEPLSFSLSINQQFTPGQSVSAAIYTNRGPMQPLNIKFNIYKITDPVGFYLKGGALGNLDPIRIDDAAKYLELTYKWERSIKQGHNPLLELGKVNNPGLYLIQAVAEDKVAYAPLIISNNVLISTIIKNKVIAYAADKETGEPISNVRFSAYTDTTLITSLFSDKEGLALIDFEGQQNFPMQERLRRGNMLFAETGEEVLISNNSLYFYNFDRNKGYVYTNQPVYRPGQEVFFKGIVREELSSGFRVPANEKYFVEIRNSKIKVFSDTLISNSMGSLAGSFILSNDAVIGYYTIEIKSPNRESFFGSFNVEEYKKPEYSVTVETDKPYYVRGDVIKGKVKAEYYFGSVVKNALVKVTVKKERYFFPYWRKSSYAWFYQLYSDNFISNRGSYYYDEFVLSRSGELNENGEFEFELTAESESYDLNYSFSAEVTDFSRRAIYGSVSKRITRGDLLISGNADRYFYKKGSPVKVNVTIEDLEEKPVSRDYTVTFDKHKRYNDKAALSSNTVNGKTGIDGKGSIVWLPPSDDGYYRYLIKTTDDKGRIVTSEGNFYVGSWEWYGESENKIEIVTDKDIYNIGDTLTAIITVSDPSVNLLYSISTNGGLKDYKMISVNEGVYTITQILTPQHIPSLNISAAYFKSGVISFTNKNVGILPSDEILSIKLTPNKPVYKPGETGEFIVAVTDRTGNPVANSELSLGMVDESIYAIAEDNVPPINQFFYFPVWLYAEFYSSNNFYGYGNSRNIFAVDSIKENSSEKGKGRLFGRVTGAEGTFRLILLNSKNFYSTYTSNDGTYRFDNIADGEYDIMIMAEQLLKTINKVSVKKELYLDIVIEQNELHESDEFFGVQPGRGNEVYLMDKAAPTAMRSSDKAMVTPELRIDFKDAAFWKPIIVTDANGEAKVNITMPDNLTSWRLTSRAITADTKVGEGKLNITVRKDLLVRMETPRFVREGDEFTISTIVHNYLNENKRTRISFTGENFTLLGRDINTPGYNTSLFASSDSMMELNIIKNSELRIDWRIKVDAPYKEIVLKAEALTNEESDAMQLPVPIYPKGYRDVTNLLINFSGEKESVRWNIGKGVDLRSAELKLHLSSTIASALLSSLDYLVEYPYGCIEQTMSRFIPAIVVENTIKQFNLPYDSSKWMKLNDVVQKGLERIYLLHNNDGGWGWWGNDGFNAYMSAYVTYGLTLAMNNGYAVNKDIYTRGLNKVVESLKSKNRMNDMETAFILFALSEAARLYPEHKDLVIKGGEEILNSFDKNSDYTNSLALLALANVNSLASANYYNKLKKNVNENESFAFWGDSDSRPYYWRNDIVQTTAYTVKALLAFSPDDKLIEKGINFLMNRRKGFAWNSTLETAIVIYALTDYLKVTGELSAEFDAAVFLNGYKIMERSFDVKDVLSEGSTLLISGKNSKYLKEGENTIEVVKKGTGKLYFSGTGSYFSGNLQKEKNNFDITREYYLLKETIKDRRVYYQKERLTTAIKPGDMIFVKTSVKGKNKGLEYFMLEDMLPSGFESVKEDYNIAIEGEGKYSGGGDYFGFWRWFYAEKEYRDNRVSFFVTYPDERMEFSYIIKAQIPGKYVAAPAEASLMYYPEINGRSEPFSLHIKE